MTQVELPESATEARAVSRGGEGLRWLPENSVTAALLPPLQNFPAGEPHVLPNEGNVTAAKEDAKPARTQTQLRASRRHTSDNFGPVGGTPFPNAIPKAEDYKTRRVTKALAG
jgi:hypothetical protein